MLRLCFLGEIEVWRDGERLALPPSRKTRALLAYLAVTGRQHRRERLCSLLWEIPDDPRGALRWSLSRLRGLVDDEDARRIVATREAVGFEPHGAEIDLATVRQKGKDPAALSTEQLAELAGQFRGEFLEGVDLPDLHDFQAWCLAEREDVRRLQGRILSALSERLAGDPAAALPHARQLVQIDPYNGEARATLLRNLMALGRRSEAEEHFDAGTRILKEVGEGAEIVLIKTWRSLRDRPRSVERADAVEAPAEVATGVAEIEAPPIAPTTDDDATPLIGRKAELDLLAGMLDSVAQSACARVALLAGEPGLGKSRLAEELVNKARAAGVQAFAGRAYEIDRGRPFGVWSEALGELAASELQPAGTSASLLTGGGTSLAAAREHLFQTVSASVFGSLAGDGPVLIVLDDIQWCDEASAELLHHFIRTNRRRKLMVLLVARSGELPDNPPLLGVLRSLRHDRLLEEIGIAPLAADEVQRLVSAIAAGSDADTIAARSGGNPLFALELARSMREGSDDLPRSLKEIVRDRIDRLPAGVADILRWASVLGPTFPVDRLVPLAAVETDQLMSGIELLERHALLRQEEDNAYLFAHDLIHQAVYTGLSEPRRRLMHLKVARVLLESGVGDETLAAEIARHAVLGGDGGVAATAFVKAGKRCLRVFANVEAASLARRGLRLAADLPEPESTQRTIELMHIEIMADRPTDLTEAVGRLEAAAERALDHDCPEHARLAFHILSELRWQRGFWSDAQRDTLRSEAVSRTADPVQRVVAMAETARCLAMLERDLDQSDALLLEATALGRRIDLEPNAISDADGLLRFYRGETTEAAALFRRARVAAQRDGERVDEFLALEHMIEIELAQNRYLEAEILAADMLRLAERLRPGSEVPFSRALDAVCRLARDDPKADRDLDKALADLRAADAKHRLSVTLQAAAEVDIAEGRLDRARQRAEEALTLVQIIDRPSDIALSRALLVEIAAASGDHGEHRKQADMLTKEIDRPVSRHAGERARAALAGTRETPGAKRRVAQN